MTPLRIGLAGFGHAVGSVVVSNIDHAIACGLPANWFVKRTGIEERRICGESEDVLSLACAAVTEASAQAGYEPSEFGHETVLVHIQNGLTHLTPPSAIVLANRLGMDTVRPIGFDGVCAEPIAALQFATLMLSSGSCHRVVLSAAVDFMPMIDATDRITSGLFGAGAGAVVLEADGARGARAGQIHDLQWETHSRYAYLGQIPIKGSNRHDGGVDIRAGYYEMAGRDLVNLALDIVPGLVSSVLDHAGWSASEVDLVVSHQPNARMLTAGVEAVGINLAVVPMPVVRLGNMGPASLLVNLSLANTDGRLQDRAKVLLLAFGLGFSCGAAALELDDPTAAHASSIASPGITKTLPDVG